MLIFDKFVIQSIDEFMEERGKESDCEMELGYHERIKFYNMFIGDAEADYDDLIGE